MKKKALIAFALFAVVAATAAFAQSQGRYYLESWNISEAVYKTLVSQRNNASISREDQYITVRKDKNTKLVSKYSNLTLDQVRQQLDAPPLGDIDFSPAQQKWWQVVFGNVSGDSFAAYMYYWIRRTE